MAFRGFQRSVGTAFPVAGDHILPRSIPYNPYGRRAAHQHHQYVYQQRALRTHPPPHWGGGGSGFPVAGEYIRTTAAQQLLPPQNYYDYYYVHQDFSINPPPPPPQQHFDYFREDETLILNGTTVHPRQQQQHAIPRNNNNGAGGGGGFGLSESQIKKCVKIIKITNSCPNYYIDNRGGATAGEEGSEVCAICLDDLYCPDQSTNNNHVGILDCRHVYHSDCIRQWLRVKNFCPMCKSVAHSSS
ncbi:PREDICTED: RING finger protein 44-like [Erythranthe guttata]|uniref:RING finger protein 44-like n=1 Tax=Erythranthe guttata TaxID=4155 RepID=UPI00064DE57F|nr:PREDICTED: RING finger protein 44-like [Erythranthe guttata]|eukprot:XP_012833078.1 PREDICTED: RING finger protein 44-like [Erythranthe guttata]